jgi:hypothetical protein
LEGGKSKLSQSKEMHPKQVPFFRRPVMNTSGGAISAHADGLVVVTFERRTPARRGDMCV